MKLSSKFEKETALFVKVCKRLAQNMYVTAFGGNCAWKVDKDVIIITPTQHYKGDVNAEDVVYINHAGETLEGTQRPTGEKPMYLNFFKERPDIVSVIHCHPPYCCAAAIAKDKNWLMRPIYPETITEVGPVPIVPYGEPLTMQLANNFLPFLPKYNSFLMANHGVVTMSRDTIEWTLMNIELLEVTAHSIYAALGAGPIAELDKSDVARLGNVMRTRNLPLFGAPGVNKSLEELYF